jgi:hypothetical protein
VLTLARSMDILKANASKWDDNTFCPSVSPTPTPTPTQTPVTPTPTPTPTPSPVPCLPGCCGVELCFDDRDPQGACDCLNVGVFYLHQTCDQDPCELAYATGIYDDDTCSTAAQPGYYQDGSGDVYFWDGSSLSFDSNCR